MITRFSSMVVLGVALVTAGIPAAADEPKPSRELRDLNKSYFPFTPVKSKAEWEIRKEEVKRRVLVASGLWPMPTKTPLNPVIHGRIERDDYTIDKVYFESLPGHYVCGSLYLPKKIEGKIPAVINPHGHWPNGRFMVANDASIKKDIAAGAERFENAARSPLQARCVQLARMGCAAFFYDMLGYADSVQFSDASGKVEHRHGPKDKGFVSAEAEHQLVGYFPLQTWNSVRVLDFITSLPYIDASRIGCTGASGGGTQTMIIGGIDERVAASFPCVMVSTAMQGGCTCENTNHLRIGAGNIDFAALTAPRPVGMTAADDWTKELETKGFPDLKNLYTMLGIPDRVEAHFDIHFPHNYNHVSRTHMYAFFNKHLKLKLPVPVLERDFTFTAPEDLTVWDAQHPKPTGDKAGTAHEVAVVEWFKQDAAKQLASVLQPKTKEDSTKQREILGGAWQTLLACKLPGKGESAFALGTKEEKSDHFFMRGATNCGKISVDGTFIYPKQWNNTVVVWLSLKGEASILDANGDLTAPARQLLAEGCSIACPILYMQGATRNPNAYDTGKRDLNSFYGYAGYHYGYNPSLFAERVHDVLATIAMIRDHDKYRAQKVVLMGVEGAGPIAAAAAALAPSNVSRLVADTEGFRFANLTNVWDINFIPGAARYGDIFGILSLCSATPTTVIDEDPKTLGNVIASFRAAGNESALEFMTPEDGKEVEVAVRAASEAK
jgi:cephalosporin-C deacetylase-like acetyl esterase